MKGGIKIIAILVIGLIGWGACGAIIAIGRTITTMEVTLIVHAIGAPIIFALLSLLYFMRFNYTNSLQTAIIFLAIVICMDAFVVAPVFEKSYELFASPLGTWIPFALIFIATYLTGLSTQGKFRKIALK